MEMNFTSRCLECGPLAQDVTLRDALGLALRHYSRDHATIVVGPGRDGAITRITVGAA